MRTKACTSTVEEQEAPRFKATQHVRPKSEEEDKGLKQKTKPAVTLGDLRCVDSREALLLQGLQAAT